MRVVFISWRDLAHPQAGGSEYVNDRLATGLQDRGHEVALLAGAPVADHGYEVVDTGGRYTQYLRAPLEHRRRFRGWDLVVDVANGMAYFSPLCGEGRRLLRAPRALRRIGRSGSPPVAVFGRFLERGAMPAAYRRQLCS